MSLFSQARKQAAATSCGVAALIDSMELMVTGRYWSPARTDVMRCVLKPSQCMRPT
jgi:hypothetical protein